MTSIEQRQVKDLFEQISKDASSLAKRAIIAENSNNDEFTKMLNYLLNPFIITGISEKKISKNTQKPPTQEFSSFNELMEYIISNNTGSDEVITNIRAFLDKQETDMSEFYASIITKSAKLGCDIKSVNKALGKEFIPQWEIQQSYNIEKSPIAENEWFSLSEKLNGVRGTFCSGKILSRQGKEITGLDHITRDIKQLFPNAENWVVDGELILENLEGLSDNENFRNSTGLLSKKDADKGKMKLIIFDFLPLDEFSSGESKLTYKARLEAIKSLGVKIKSLGIRSVETVDVLYTGNDAKMIDYFLEKMVSLDKEGLMLNRDSKYYCKRHSGILKVKRFYTVDLVVTDLIEGSGRLSGKLGAFVVEYKGNALNVGSGMTDEERVDFWRIRDELAGRVIEVKYKEESVIEVEDKKEGSDKKISRFSLQFPVFVSLREEGKEESLF
ncbi:MAG: hypothetical protein FWH17_05430 [Oscillospiraceae bacterium]|nr:hypothetical protein [Oscillospiraceae bacterium]